MYQELLRIKQYREQTAANAVTRRQHVADERRQQLQQARDRAAEFHQYRLQQEQQLFDDIRGQPVLLRAIDTMKQKVSLLREQEATLESEILAAQKRLTEAEQAVEQAKERHMAAVREHEKFKQFAEAQRAAEEYQLALKEENEIEETAASGARGSTMME